MKNPYIVHELRKQTVSSNYVETIHRYSRVEDMIYYADLLAAEAEQDIRDGKIVDFEIWY